MCNNGLSQIILTLFLSFRELISDNFSKGRQLSCTCTGGIMLVIDLSLSAHLSKELLEQFFIFLVEKYCFLSCLPIIITCQTTRNFSGLEAMAQDQVRYPCNFDCLIHAYPSTLQERTHYRAVHRPRPLPWAPKNERHSC